MVSQEERREILNYIREEKEREQRLMSEHQRIERELNACRSKQKRFSNMLLL